MNKTLASVLLVGAILAIILFGAYGFQHDTPDDADLSPAAYSQLRRG